MLHWFPSTLKIGLVTGFKIEIKFSNMFQKLSSKRVSLVYEGSTVSSCIAYKADFDILKLFKEITWLPHLVLTGIFKVSPDFFFFNNIIQ